MKLVSAIFKYLHFITFLVLLFFVFINYKGLGLDILYRYGLPFALLTFILKYKMTWRFFLGLLLIYLFELTYYFIIDRYIFTSRLMTFKLLPFIIFFLGYLSLGQNSLDENLKFVKITIFVVILAFFIYGTLNVYEHVQIKLQDEVFSMGSVIYDIWNKDYIAATNQSSKFTLALGLMPIIFYTKFKKRILIKIIYFVMLIISIVALLLMGRRTWILILFFNFGITTMVYIIINLKYLITFKKKKIFEFFISILFVGLFIFILSYIYKNNIFCVQEFIKSTTFYSRFNMENYKLIIDDVRFDFWKAAFNGMKTYPFGGFLTEGINSYAHNLWLDVAYATGKIPFYILSFITLLYLLMIFILFLSKKIPNDFKIIIISLTISLFLNYMVEPIMEGYFHLFLTSFLFGGLFLRIRDNMKTAKVITT